MTAEMTTTEQEWPKSLIGEREVILPEPDDRYGTALEWHNASGDVHLSGGLAGHGTQWLLPWRQPDGTTGEIFYNRQGYSVDGTYYGETITGRVVLEGSRRSEQPASGLARPNWRTNPARSSRPTVPISSPSGWARPRRSSSAASPKGRI